jgi:mycothiol system anti-sigma-R factor
MNCTKVKETLFLFFDDEMPQSDQSRFQEHLSGCPHCARRVSYTRRLLILVRSSCGRRVAPDGLRLRIVTSLPHRRGSGTLH